MVKRMKVFEIKGKVLYYRGKKIGLIREDSKEFFAIKPYSALYRNRKSLGFEEEILNFLKERGIKKLRICFIHEDGSKEWFRTPLEIWFNAGTKLKYLGRRQYHMSLAELRRITRKLLGEVL